MAAKKKRPTRRRTTKAQTSGFMSGCLVFAGLVGVATAGWYISLNPTTNTKPQRTASASTTAPVSVPIPVNAPSNTPEPRERIVVPAPKVAADLAEPQPLTQQAATNVPRPRVAVGATNNDPTIDSIISASINNTSKPTAAPKVAVANKPVPAKVENTAPKAENSLPLKARLQPNNGAQPVYARDRITIYAIADTAGPKLTVVERGQELRSYEKQGSWHRVTVPRTGVIGWARDEGLSVPANAAKTASLPKR